MSIEDRMTVDERRKYLGKMQERYLPSSRVLWPSSGLATAEKPGDEDRMGGREV